MPQTQALGQVDRRRYETAVMATLRDRLRAGDVWVDGTRNYRRFDTYLLSRREAEAAFVRALLGGVNLAAALEAAGGRVETGAEVAEIVRDPGGAVTGVALAFPLVRLGARDRHEHCAGFAGLQRRARQALLRTRWQSRLRYA